MCIYLICLFFLEKDLEQWTYINRETNKTYEKEISKRKKKNRKKRSSDFFYGVIQIQKNVPFQALSTRALPEN